MHAGPEDAESAFAAQGVVEREDDGSRRSEGREQEPKEYQAKFVEDPDVVAEEAMETRPMSNADLVAAEDEFGDVVMSDGEDPTGHQRLEEREARSGEHGLEGTQQLGERSGKMFHGRPSLAWDRVRAIPLCQGGRPFTYTGFCLPENRETRT